MAKAYLVARREFVENLRTKTFWIGILIFPVMLLLMFTVPLWLQKSKDVRFYAVLDHSRQRILEAVEERAALPDVRHVLEEAIKAVDKGDPLDGFPPAITGIARNLHAHFGGEVPAQQIQVTVDTLVGTPEGMKNRELISQVMPDRSAFDASITEIRAQLKEWWKTLTPEEAKRYGSDLGRARYQRLEVEGATEEKLGAMLDDGEIFAYFVIGPDPVADSAGCKYVSNNHTDRSLKKWFATFLNEEVQKRRFENENIDQNQALRILRPIDFEEKKLGAGGQEEAVATTDKVRQWVPMIFAYVLWIAVFAVAQMLLTNTIEEKSNRIIEVLLSSVSPLQLMSGKIAGIAATGLTILTSWVIFLFLGVKFLPRILGSDLGFDLTFVFSDPLYLSSFIGYFLLGYLFYAAFLVGMGSVCNSLKEAQNLMQPVMLLMIVPLLAILPITEDPNGALARLLSYIPPFTPFVMMNRSAGPPSPQEYVMTSLLLLAATALAFWAAAKVFRIGILMTGKRPKLFEILRWIRTPAGQIPPSTAPASEE